MLRCDNAALTADLAAAMAATSAQATHLQREAALHAHLDEAKRGTNLAQERAREARKERDFFMAQSTEAAALAASATAARDNAKQVSSHLHNLLTMYMLCRMSCCFAVGSLIQSPLLADADMSHPSALLINMVFSTL